MRFEIGDKVFWATNATQANHIKCPDCGGTGRPRVTFHDDTEACSNCSLGYDPPTGFVRYFSRVPAVKLVEITGLEITAEKISWQISGAHIISNEDLFRSESQAMERARVLFEMHEREHILKKEKDTKTWAWNATYHRRAIKAQRRSPEGISKMSSAELKAANDRIGKWLSAALDDAAVCQEMKSDIKAWFDAVAKLDALAGNGEKLG